MEAKSEAKALDSIVAKIPLRLVSMGMVINLFFCVKQARKYEALKASRMSLGNLALCSILINE
jgi:hypothetical protein